MYVFIDLVAAFYRTIRQFAMPLNDTEDYVENIIDSCPAIALPIIQTVLKTPVFLLSELSGADLQGSSDVTVCSRWT